MCFILLTFSCAGHEVRSTTVSFGLFLFHQGKAKSNSALISARLANFANLSLFSFFFRIPSRILQRTALKKCSCALGLRLPMPLLTFNKTFRTRVPCRASPVVIPVVAFYTIHGNRCQQLLLPAYICGEINEKQRPQKRWRPHRDFWTLNSGKIIHVKVQTHVKNNTINK